MPGMFSTPAAETRAIDENGKTESRVNFTSSEDENEVAGSSKPNDPVTELCVKFPKVPRGDITRSKF